MKKDKILAVVALGAIIVVTIAMTITCGVGIGMRIQLKRDQNFMKGMKSMTVSFQGDTSLDDWYEYIKWENS